MNTPPQKAARGLSCFGFVDACLRSDLAKLRLSKFSPGCKVFCALHLVVRLEVGNNPVDRKPP